ncbi:MAG TPA: calcium-binding protein [Conexibacter sp.]|nr:calcium-binding protein [Conexibacter sp.]
MRSFTTRRHRWLPAVLAATAALGAAATADAATLTGSATRLVYEGTADDDTIAVTPNGTGFAIESSSAITVDIVADPLCSPGGRIVSCVVDRPLRVDGGAGGDTITMQPATGGTTPNAAFELYGSPGADRISGGALPELISGGADGDRITGGGDGDEIYGGSGDDAITGGTGNDRIGPGLGDDGDVIGGDGVDTIFYSDGAGVVVDLSTTAGRDGAADDGEEDAIGFENVEGTTSSDTIGGTGGPNTIKGNGGDDELFGAGGDDELYGSDGDDLIGGGEGDDVIMGFLGEDSLLGDGGSDKLYGGEGEGILRGGPGSDLIDGGNGSNTADYSERSESVTVDLTATGFVNGGALDDADGAGPLTARDRLVSIARVATGSGSDTINAFDGLAGSVQCGDSSDTAIWDDADAVTGCERRESLSRGGPGEGEEDESGQPGGGGAGDGAGGTGGGSDSGASGGAGGTGVTGGTGGQPGATTPPTTTPLAPRLGSTVTGAFRTKRGRTTVRRLTLGGAVKGTTVTIACAAPAKNACPFKQRTIRVRKTAKRLDLTKALRGRVFRKSAALTVTVGGPGWTSVGTRYAVRAAGAPKATAL